MNADTEPLQVLLVTLDGWVNRNQQWVIEYLAHDHRERNHEGIGDEFIEGEPSMGTGVVGSTERRGGMLRYYHCAA